ncbi:DUF7344 domain-containing protein [Halorarius litoreus]|uniref:DUF7344 domain-containing protein n=1 Tax=Halorarius litoreus TaxID=2962676 RepID=UPI0020CD3F17|nr:hypothetical protein [Halorarius litoreus]
MPEDIEPQTLDSYYHVLADERRRILVDALEPESSMTLDQLTREVYLREARTDPPETVRLSLIHQHVPLLADVDALEFDRQEEQVVAKEPAIAQLSSLLGETLS